MHTFFHVNGDWTALTPLVRFSFLKKLSQSLQNILHRVEKNHGHGDRTALSQLNHLFFYKVMTTNAIHRSHESTPSQKIPLYTSLQCKSVGR